PRGVDRENLRDAQADRRQGHHADQIADHVIRYFFTAAWSQLKPLPGRCGGRAKPSTMSSGCSRILSAQSTDSRSWRGGGAGRSAAREKGGAARRGGGGGGGPAGARRGGAAAGALGGGQPVAGGARRQRLRHRRALGEVLADLNRRRELARERRIAGVVVVA